MKVKLKQIGVGILGLFLCIGCTTPLFSNLWGLLSGNGYRIPKESSVFTFKVTRMNESSGDYWLYGEDKTFFYTQAIAGENKPYIKIAKSEAQSKNNFNPYDVNTWNTVYHCGDVFKRYADSIKNLEFMDCEVVRDSQTLIRATYRVSGTQSKAVENFLVDHYGMGKLKWACCGWDNAGKYGSFEHAELKKIDPYCTVLISMYASGEVENKNNPSEIIVERDRNKIAYFTVVAEIVIV